MLNADKMSSSITMPSPADLFICALLSIISKGNSEISLKSLNNLEIFQPFLN